MSTPIVHDEAPKSLRKPAIVGGALLCALLAGALIVAGIFPRLRSAEHREETGKVLGSAEPGVVLLHPREAPSHHLLTLPGSLEAFQEIAVNARADGYVRKWNVDIGDHVHTGQLLATLDAPELLQQRSEARADVAQAQAQVFQAQADTRRVEAERPRLQADEEKARAEVMQQRAEILGRRSDAAFAKVTNDRWQKLVSQQAISLEEADKRASAYQTARANVDVSVERRSAAQGDVRAAQARETALVSEIASGRAREQSARALVVAKQAAVQRIDALLAFLDVRAPFNGVITARLIDTGSLVSSGGEHTTLFRVGRTDRLRLFVDVPESDVPSIRVGQQARLNLREFPSRHLRATITRTTGALDRATRTLKTQLELANPGFLDPGMHADVSLEVNRRQQVFLVPSTALVIRPDGPRLLVMDASARVHFVPIQEGLDLGKEVEVVRGLEPGAAVVNFPSDSLTEGMKVSPIQGASS